MRKERFIKLAILTIITVFAYLIDTHFGVVSTGILFATVGVAGEIEEPEKVIDKTTKDFINNKISSEIGTTKSEIKTEIDLIKNNLTTIENLVRDGAGGRELTDLSDSKNKNEYDKIIKNSILGMYRNKPDMIHNSFLNETTEASGAYLVPAEWYKQILDNVKEHSSILRNAKIFNLSAKELKLNQLDTNSTWSFDSAEGEERAVSNPTFKQISLQRNDGGYIVLISKSLLEDEAFNLTEYLTYLAGRIFTNAIENVGYLGNTTPAIKGLLKAGNGCTDYTLSTTSINALTFDEILNGMALVPSSEITESKWYLSPSVWALIKQLKVDKSYAVDKLDRINSMLEGRPVELSDYSYTVAQTQAGRKMFTFGNLQNLALGLRNNLTIEISKDATVTTGGTNYNAFQRGLIAFKFNGSIDFEYLFPTSIVNFTNKSS